MKPWITLTLAALLSGCVGIPQGVQPVRDFELARYLGQWYEIARLDHSFERGLSRVSAEYQRRDDGGITVINRGYREADNQWTSAEGKAYFVNEPDQAYLKVSFFGPFYGSYVVFDIDRNDYQYAFVSGPTLNYLWLLARTPTVDEKVIERFIEAANARGFDTDQLIFVSHTAPQAE
ncbi:lipocalin family protein [Motiliproteus sediminis]|uniref:lipocalin family protein n=1 Tax=Motiliproteus sediminis TaxID=1468178 RepID=UPI001AEF4121|nr:lipocalin family protein [Motiliproteus sediminis]